MNALHPFLPPEALGWFAALLTLLTFVSADMRRLRLLALAANAAFIAYGSTAQLLPVMVLHLALVPVNLWRLNQAFQRQADTAVAAPIAAPIAAPVTAPSSAPYAPRKPNGWAPAPRGARRTRRQSLAATNLQPSEPGTGRA